MKKPTFLNLFLFLTILLMGISVYSKTPEKQKETTSQNDLLKNSTWDTSVDMKVPTIPRNLRAFNLTQSSLTLIWNSSTSGIGVTGYDVYRNGVPFATTPLAPVLQIQGLAPGRTYSFKVRGKDTSGNSSFSNVLTVTTLSPPDTQAPTAPVSLTTSNIATTTLTLNWTAATDNVGVTGYDVYRGSTVIGTATTTTFNVTGLTAATSYTFKVRAKDAAGNVSSDSNVVNVTTLPPPDTQAPTAPTSLAASNIAQTTLTLNWIAATDNVGVAFYGVYKGSTVIDIVTTPTFNATGLIAGTGYTFKVRAMDAAGNISSDSNVVTVTTLPPPLDTQAPTTPLNLRELNDITSESVNLVWTAATDNVGVTGYDAYRGSTFIGAATTTTFSVTGLTAATAYAFKVRAKDAAGNVSPFSNEITVTTLPPPDTQAPTTPLNLRAFDITSESVNLHWNVATDNVAVEAYELYQGNTLISYTQANSSAIEGLAPATTYTFKVRAKDAAGNLSQFSNVLTLTTPNAMNSNSNANRSIEEEGSIRLIIYPNSVRDESLHLNLLNANATEFVIYNMSGQLVRKGEGAYKNSIDVSRLESGTYIIKVNANGKTFSKSFIKE